MRRRLYFLLPDLKHARQVFKDLLLARIDDTHIHFMARDGKSLGDLPEATVLQKSDAVHGLGVGLIVGGFTGAVAGTVVLFFPPAGLVMGLGVVLIMALLGALIGTWASGMIAASTPNTHLARFADDLKHGKILLMLDVPKDRIEEITHTIQKHKAVEQGRDPTIPAFP